MKWKSLIFVRHVQKHLTDKDIKGKVICKICNKDIDQIYKEEVPKKCPDCGYSILHFTNHEALGDIIECCNCGWHKIL